MTEQALIKDAPVAQSYDYREQKTVVTLAAHLDPGAAMNIVGHLAISLGARANQEIMGREWLVDASGIRHRGISRFPVIITRAKQPRLRKLLAEARATEGLFVADFPEQMLSTGHDDELSAALADVPEDSINYLGVLIHGAIEAISPLTGKFPLW